MPAPPLLLLLLLPFFVHLSADPVPNMGFETRFSKHRINRVSSAGPPVEHIAVVRPLPTEKLTPAYTMRVLSHGFGQTVGLPPVTSTYYAPECGWSRAVIEIAGYCNGTQYDRIGGVWLSCAELIRTSTPQSGSEGIFWKVQKDITRYYSLLRQTNITLSVMLENAVDDIHFGSYWLDITFLFYEIPIFAAQNATDKFHLSLRRPNEEPESEKIESTKYHGSLVLDENPADLIIPICASGEEGFWFKIQSGMDSVVQGITIPQNTYRAVLEVYISPHDNDETWFANPPDSYIEMNGLPTKRGHGAFREVRVKLDKNVVGSTIPFPVFYGGGINPLFWEPLAAIRAFDFPTYEFELTPFLGMLLDGRKHYYGLNVADAISYWLAHANLHIFLDKTGQRVLAGAIKYNDPNTCVERESKFQQLDGKFEVEADGDSEWSGWVYSSRGNYTTHVTRKIDFENTIKFHESGSEKEVKQEVKVETRVRVTTRSGHTFTRLNEESKFPLKLRITDLDGEGEGRRLLTTKLEHSLMVEQHDREYKSKLHDSQTCKGWMFVLDRDVLSGKASTRQRYKLEDRFGCYSRRVEAEGGVIQNNESFLLCAEAAS